MATLPDTTTSSKPSLIAEQIAQETIKSAAMKAKLKHALHATTVQALREQRGQTLRNLRRQAEASHQAIFGVRSNEKNMDQAGDEMGPMILGDYTVHQTVPSPELKTTSSANTVLKLAAAGALMVSGLGLPGAAYLALSRWPKSEAIPVQQKTEPPRSNANFTDRETYLTLPYETVVESR